jgi:predicted GIY-YIG superfamily endonuclease
MEIEDYLEELISTEKVINLLSDVKSGIYAAWYQNNIIYIGQSKNIYKRISKHYGGQRGSNQFCTYIFDNFLIKTISLEGQKLTQRFNQKTQEFIKQNITFSLIFIEENKKLVQIETDLRKLKNGKLEMLINKLE